MGKTEPGWFKTVSCYKIHTDRSNWFWTLANSIPVGQIVMRAIKGCI